MAAVPFAVLVLTCAVALSPPGPAVAGADGPEPVLRLAQSIPTPNWKCADPRGCDPISPPVQAAPSHGSAVPEVLRWFCGARAPNGAQGNANVYPSEVAAKEAAMEACVGGGGGRSCRIVACVSTTMPDRPPWLVTTPARGSAAAAPPRPAPAARPATAARPKGCPTCLDNLRRNIDAGWATGAFHTYLLAAVVGYGTCKSMLGESCPDGDRRADALRNTCLGAGSDAEIRACVGNVMR